MYCMKCRASNRANKNICEVCGTPLLIQFDFKDTHTQVDDIELDEDVIDFVDHVDQVIIRLTNIITEKE